METKEKTFITVESSINAPVSTVWKKWTNPSDITQWNNASPDWHTPHATNDLRVGGALLWRMEAKDGSMGFDFEGTYTQVIPEQLIAYNIIDGREVSISFKFENGKTTVIETFEPENQNSLELQKGGWQSILDNFKRYCEGN
jgi:uncharacterized protein YndB with AHSA1/START domain